MENQQNPLSKYFRQPEIYIKLPSEGKYWDEGSLDLGVTGEIPVYPMTTKDEITLKTPDALLNGEGVVAVIKSCCPNIKDPWKMPSVDVDYVLIAIRIASYGHELKFDSKCPKCGEISTYGQDMRPMLESIKSGNYDRPIKVDNLTFKFKPQKYFELNTSNQIQFEEQKTLQMLEDPNLDETVKKLRVKENLERLLDLNYKTLVYSTENITTEDGTIVEDQKMIMEFYQNTSATVIKAVQENLKNLGSDSNLKPFKIKCNNCGNEYETKFEFDYASFFELGF